MEYMKDISHFGDVPNCEIAGSLRHVRIVDCHDDSSFRLCRCLHEPRRCMPHPAPRSYPGFSPKGPLRSNAHASSSCGHSGDVSEHRSCPRDKRLVVDPVVSLPPTQRLPPMRDPSYRILLDEDTRLRFSTPEPLERSRGE
eukprot:scaffold762_cov363-Pavlova_lutheri.AAC.71